MYRTLGEMGDSVCCGLVTTLIMLCRYIMLSTVVTISYLKLVNVNRCSTSINEVRW